MKTCPNCGETNGEANDKCYKCGADLSGVSGEKRYCEYCKEIYSPRTKECPNCGMPTIVYNPATMSQIHNTGNVDMWMYVIAFLIPIVGLILGCIQVGKNDKSGGKKLIITSIVSFILYVIVVSAISSSREKQAADELSSLYDSYSYSYDIDD